MKLFWIALAAVITLAAIATLCAILIGIYRHQTHDHDAADAPKQKSM